MARTLPADECHMRRTTSVYSRHAIAGKDTIDHDEIQSPNSRDSSGPNWFHHRSGQAEQRTPRRLKAYRGEDHGRSYEQATNMTTLRSSRHGQVVGRGRDTGSPTWTAEEGAALSSWRGNRPSVRARMAADRIELHLQSSGSFNRPHAGSRKQYQERGRQLNPAKTLTPP